MSPFLLFPKTCHTPVSLCVCVSVCLNPFLAVMTPHDVHSQTLPRSVRLAKSCSNSDVEEHSFPQQRFLVSLMWLSLVLFSEECCTDRRMATNILVVLHCLGRTVIHSTLLACLTLHAQDNHSVTLHPSDSRSVLHCIHRTIILLRCTLRTIVLCYTASTGQLFCYTALVRESCCMKLHAQDNYRYTAHIEQSFCYTSSTGQLFCCTAHIGCIILHYTACTGQTFCVTPRVWDNHCYTVCPGTVNHQCSEPH